MTKLNVQKMEDIGKLPDNWNGYGARKFSPSLINKCQEIAKSLPEVRKTKAFRKIRENGNYDKKWKTIYKRKRICRC